MSNLSQHRNPSPNFLTDVQKPTIALDLDGVSALGREYFIGRMKEMYDISMPNGWVTDTNPEIPQLGCRYTDEVRRIVSDDLSVFLDIDPVPGSVEAIQELSNDYKIKIVTHRVRRDGWMPERRGEVRQYTEQWLDKNGFHYDEFVCPTPHNKSDVNADVYIDDRKSNLENATVMSGKLPVMFLREYNSMNVPRGAWVASASENVRHGSMTRSLEKQWNVIQNELTQI